jgi:hypothetical protein
MAAAVMAVVFTLGLSAAGEASQGAGAPADEIVRVKASGPVPNGIAQAAAAGDPFYQLAKYVWESGGEVIPTADGEYIIPMPEKIPADFIYPPESIPARAASDAAITAEDVTAPPYLAPDEYELFTKCMTEGLGFSLEGARWLPSCGEIGGRDDKNDETPQECTSCRRCSASPPAGHADVRSGQPSLRIGRAGYHQREEHEQRGYLRLPTRGGRLC